MVGENKWNGPGQCLQTLHTRLTIIQGEKYSMSDHHYLVLIIRIVHHHHNERMGDITINLILITIMKKGWESGDSHEGVGCRSVAGHASKWKSTLHNAQCTLYTSHITTHCTQHTAHNTLHNAHATSVSYTHLTLPTKRIV